jgi:hypothetical protein
MVVGVGMGNSYSKKSSSLDGITSLTQFFHNFFAQLLFVAKKKLALGRNLIIVGPHSKESGFPLPMVQLCRV